jgi:C-terminal processing protease CtpA/Prc
LEIQDVGIEWDAYLLRSKTLNMSNIVQLRVKAMDPKGPAHTSGRIRVGDRLVSIDGEEVMGQAAALQIAKVNGPSGPH